MAGASKHLSLARAGVVCLLVPLFMGATCRPPINAGLTVLQQTLLHQGMTIAEVAPSDLHPIDTNDYWRTPLNVGGSWTKPATRDLSVSACGTLDAEFVRCGACAAPAPGADPATCWCPNANMERRMIELRGWLRRVETSCASDRDARWDLEVDPEWADSIGLQDLNGLIRVGNILLNVDPGDRALDPAPGSFSAVVSSPSIHLELHPWIPSSHPGQTPPATWIPTTTFASYCPAGSGDLWPFNPVRPLAFRDELSVGQYVRAVGALITDMPHLDTGGLLANHVTSPPCWAGGADHSKRGGSQLEVCDLNAVRHAWVGDQFVAGAWANQRCFNQGSYMTRWTEMHPVDFIAPLDPKERVETVRVAAVVAENGLFEGKTETIDFEMRPPNPRPAGARIDVREFVEAAATNQSSVREHKVEALDDRVHVRVSVRGERAYGAKGKFKAVYRVRWKVD